MIKNLNKKEIEDCDDLLIQEKKTEPLMSGKTLDIDCVKKASENISDLKTYGEPNTFRLLCKASSEKEGWMKSTKVCNCGDNCIVQVTTQQRNPDGSYAIAEALAFVKDTNIDINQEPRVLRSTR